MAYPLVQIVQDDTTVLYDLNDAAGATNLNGLRTVINDIDFDLGDSPLETATFEGEHDGGFITHKRRGFSPMTWRMATLPASSDQAFTESIGYLGHLLEQGGTFRVQKSAAASTVWTEFLPSPAPALFRGQARSLFKVLTLLRDPDGVLMAVRRQPYWRGPMLDGAMNNTLVNPMMLLDSNDNGVPDGWTSAAGTHSISAVDNAYQNSHTAAVNLLTQNVAAASGQTWTFSVEARVVSGSGDARITVASVGGTGSQASGMATTSAWARLTATVTLGGATTAVQARLEQVNASGTTVLQFRKAQLEQASTGSKFVPSAVIVPNDPADSGGRVLLGHIDGDLPTPVHVKVKGDTGSKLQEILVALMTQEGGHRWLADYANAVKFINLSVDGLGWDVTHTNVVSAAATDSAASGGTAVQVSDTGGASLKRVRATRTTKLDALRGEWDVWLAGRPAVGSNGNTHLAKLGWSPSVADPPVYFTDEVEITQSSIAGTPYTSVNLGRIAIPEDTRHVIGGFSCEVHTRSLGTSDLFLDFLFFVPVSEFASTIYVPWGTKETFLGRELVEPTDPTAATPGTVDGDFMLLDGNGDTAAEPPAGGRALPAGRHRWTFKMTGRGDGEAQVRVRRVGAPGTNHLLLVTGGLSGFDFTTEPYEWVLEGDVTDGAAYHGQVEKTGGGTLAVESISHEFLPYISANQSVHTEPEDDVVHKLDSSGDLVSYLRARGGVPVVMPPGPFALPFMFSDVRHNAEYPHLESKISRDPTVTIEYAPRWNQP